MARPAAAITAVLLDHATCTQQEQAQMQHTSMEQRLCQISVFQQPTVLLLFPLAATGPMQHGGCLPAVEQLANVAALPGIVK